MGIRAMSKLVKVAIFATSVLFAGLSSAQTPAHGVREFQKTGTFEVPAGVSQITVELWGGGGAGAGGNVGGMAPGSGGGGGGSGSYMKAILAVKAGEVYTIEIGRGGQGGPGESGKAPGPGENGGDSSIRRGTETLLQARGGRGGLAGRSGGRGGAGGGAPETTGAITRAGNPGTDGHIGGHTEWTSTSGGNGGAAVRGSVDPPGSFGGVGGAGKLITDGAESGKPGGDGSAIVSW